MKLFYRSVLILSLTFLPRLAEAQTYGNEWIDFSKTYVKFKVGKEGVFRISRAALDAAGVPTSVVGTNFSMWFDGQEVPIYVSTNSFLGTNDFIEFFGVKPDGKMDTELFTTPYDQPNDRVSLFTDTSVYFLTWDNGSAHSRYGDATGSIPLGVDAETYVYTTAAIDYTGTFFTGDIVRPPEHTFYTSLFTQGEGFIRNYVNIINSQTIPLSTPNLVTVGPGVNFNTSYLTQADVSTHEFKIQVNGTDITDIVSGVTKTVHFDTTNLPASLFAAGSNSITYVPVITGVPANVYGVSFIKIEYPRDLNLNNGSYLRFKLQANTNQQYLEFTNFNNAANQPRLYDLTNRKYYTGDISVPGVIRYYILPSFVDREMVVYSDNNTTNLATIVSSGTRHFVDYTTAAQGTFVMITHPELEALVNGHNYVQEYADYRASAAGGSHAVMVADITELYDQFTYGYEFHPLSVRRFLQYASDKWETKPKDIFLVGRGILYNQAKTYRANRSIYTFPVVPTFGYPGSDVDLVNISGSTETLPFTVGRLSVWNGQEIGDYLEKVKGYELAIKPAAFPTAATELWKKQVLHIAGAEDGFCDNMASAGLIISDTFTGKVITAACKSTTGTVADINSAQVNALIDSGISMLTFYGHASNNIFEYNINNPESYNSAPRLPFFLALGCDVAQMFTLDVNKTITERYILSKTGGAVVMVAGDNTGWSDYLYPGYVKTYYRKIAVDNYSGTMGEQYQAVYDSMMHGHTPGTSNYLFHITSTESMIYAGDPAVPPYNPALPDYHVATNALSAIPANISNNSDSFNLRIVGYNLAKVTNDTVQVKVEHINPNGVVSTVGTYFIPHLTSTDTGFMTVPVDEFEDIGLNTYRVTIESEFKYDEISEANNVADFEVFIYSDDLIPVYPQEFSIVHQQPVTLKASTLNPFRPMGRFVMQIDTTELFNSPLMLQTTINSPGGVIKWTPPIALQDSVVYYWRSAIDSVISGSIHWTNSSFIYLANGSDGWNQSHYFQWLKDTYDDLNLEADRVFRFPPKVNKLEVRNTVLYSDADVAFVTDYENESLLQSGGINAQGEIQIEVFDSLGGQPFYNVFPYGIPSWFSPGGHVSTGPFHAQFSKSFFLNVPSDRAWAAAFLADSIPCGHYVMVKNYVYSSQWDYPSFLDTIKADHINTITMGNVSLYDALKNIGFTKIDTLTGDGKRAFIFFTQKCHPASAQQFINTGAPGDNMVQDFFFNSRPSNGSMHSTVIGPATEWKQLKWKTFANDGFPQNDTLSVKISGMKLDGTIVPLCETYNRDTELAWIDADLYPRIKMDWISIDSLQRTSGQQAFWRVLFSPVPEAALNPAAYFTMIDSAASGQHTQFGVAIENLTPLPMDSMLVRYRVINNSGSMNDLTYVRYRPMVGEGDTIHADLNFDGRPFPGNNYLFIEANPNNDQIEQYHPNNLGYIPFKVGVDLMNPLLDVTFDGVHILNRDIVSAKPFIKIILRDENQYLRLEDTSMLTVDLHYPDDDITTFHRIPFDGTICKFIPANSSGANEATIEFRPDLVQDGFHTLRLNGRDVVGNTANRATYNVEFEVVTKNTVSSVLNYPNPFSTSTAFVFTLTGTELPSQFKIQIVSVTGKVVKEITRQELGPLHIGRNITDYKWDGRDQYGQLLGNGVYMYRVVTAINGTDIEHRQSNADQFFKNGWGKMYIMR